MNVLLAADASMQTQIAMGTRGRDLPGRAMLGSIAGRVLATNTDPVLLLK